MVKLPSCGPEQKRDEDELGFGERGWWERILSKVPNNQISHYHYYLATKVAPQDQAHNADLLCVCGVSPKNEDRRVKSRGL